MELKLSNVLHAEVKASVSPSNLDIYGFTLYHGYKVKEVKDESGRELKFKQTGDWIQVESAERLRRSHSATTDIQIHTTATDRARLCREHLLIIPAQVM